MQHIFHHDNSGNDAFTGNLLTHDNMKATSLHPIKKPNYLYRLHNFFNQRKIFDLRQKFFHLERDIFKLKNELGSNYNNVSVNSLNASSEFERFFKTCGSILDDRFMREFMMNDARNPLRREDRSDFDFFTRSLFSSTYVSPKRGLEGYWQQSIVENLRQIMDKINHDSIDRGRLIDYKGKQYYLLKSYKPSPS